MEFDLISILLHIHIHTIFQPLQGLETQNGRGNSKLHNSKSHLGWLVVQL